MFGNKLPALSELTFATPGHPWDERDAAARIAEKLGRDGLEEYSLCQYPQSGSETSVYRLLVADIHDSHPVIIPAALEAARRSLDGLEGSVRDRAEMTLELLEEKYKRTTQVTGEQVAEDEVAAGEVAVNEAAAGEPISDDVTVEKVPIEEEPAHVQTASSESPAENNSSGGNESVPESASFEESSVTGGSQSEISDAEESEANPETADNVVGADEASRMVNRLAERGNLLPAWGYKQLVKFIAGLSTDKTVKIEGAESLSPAKYFLDLIESLPALIPAQEFAPSMPPSETSFESLGKRIAQAIKQND